MTCRAPSGASASAGPSSLSCVGKGPRAVDLYAQALKALTEHSPFDTEEALSRVAKLPAGLAAVFARSSDGRRKHKKTDSDAPPQKPAPVVSTLWDRVEPCFRPVSLTDIEALALRRLFCTNSVDTHLCVPNLGAPFVPCEEVAVTNRESPVIEGDSNPNDMIPEDCVKVEGLEASQPRVEHIKTLDNGAKPEVPVDGSSMNWVFGSKQRCLLASERPNKKRKLLGIDAGLEQLLLLPHTADQRIAHHCDVCCSSKSSSESNKLINCQSCKVVVHQKCYGICEDQAQNWICSWCKHLEQEANLSSIDKEHPCLLCPKAEGALKPVEENSRRNLNMGQATYAHLFCSLWAPELYIDNIPAMEPILSIDAMKEARLKLVCYLCKMKHGTCMRCSHGTCRTSFHPLCARGANLKMEIWGKFGCDNVELRAFCLKHSTIRGTRSTKLSVRPKETVSGDSSAAPAQLEVQHTSKQLILKLSCKKRDKSIVQDETNMLVNEDSNAELIRKDDLLIVLPEDAGDHVDKARVDTIHESDDGYLDVSNAVPILKKLIDQQIIKTSDMAMVAGVAADSLEASIIGETTSLSPHLCLKILKWLQDSGYLAPLGQKMVDNVTIASEGHSVASSDNSSAAKKIASCDIGNAVYVDAFENLLPPCERTNGDVQLFEELKLVNEDKPQSINEHSVDGPSELLHINNEIPRTHANGELHAEGSLHGGQDHTFEDRSPWQPHSDFHSMLSGTSSIKVGEFYSIASVHPLIQRKLRHGTALPEQVVCEKRRVPVHSAVFLNSDTLDEAAGAINDGKLEQLEKARSAGILDLSPDDEVEGELIYFQDKLFEKSMEINHLSDKLVSKVLQGISKETDAATKQQWDQVLIFQYLREVKESKKRGRRERRHKEAQAVLAAATSAAATSSRNSSLRKDTSDDVGAANIENSIEVGAVSRRAPVAPPSASHAKESLPRPAIIKVPPDRFSSMFQIPELTKNNGLYCDICKRTETLLNRIFICSRCKVAVHLDCYKRLSDPIGPWKCELCEDLLSQSGSPRKQTIECGEEDFRVCCGLCGGYKGAFRKSTSGQWVHSFCAEWLLESNFTRGQQNLVEGMDLLFKEKNAVPCSICHQRVGICLKCSYGNCQMSFHPSCARNAGFYMNMKTISGKLQHKAYCEKHSVEQREKADSQQYGPEELKSIKHIRVELEKMRLLCERIVKREKVKRDLVLCSHEVLASRKDYAAFSVLLKGSLFSRGASSESATTSLDNRSFSGMVQRSDDYTVDSTVSGNHSVKGPSLNEIDRKNDDSSTSQLTFKRKFGERATFSGKQLPRGVASTALKGSLDNAERKSKVNKPETFQKEQVRTSEQALMKNPKLPQGCVYVPVSYVSKEKPGNCDNTPFQEPQDPGG